MEEKSSFGMKSPIIQLSTCQIATLLFGSPLIEFSYMIFTLKGEATRGIGPSPNF